MALRSVYLKAKIKNYIDRKAGRRGVIGGTIGTAAGMALGNLLEGERRRRVKLKTKNNNSFDKIKESKN